MKIYRQAAYACLASLWCSLATSVLGQEDFAIRFTPASGIVGEKVVFHAEPLDASAQGHQLSWKFGDGSEATPYSDSNIDSAEHVFAAPGRYPVLLRYRKDGVTRTMNRLLSVSGKPTPARPTASATLALSRDGRYVWCVNPDQNSVTRIDARTLQFDFETPVGNNPAALAEDPAGRIWVSNKGSATVSVVDPQSGGTLRTIALPYGSQPHGLVFSPDGKSAYVALQAVGKIAVLDATGMAEAHFLDVGRYPRALALSHDGMRLLSPRFLSDRAGAEIASIRIGSALPLTLEKSVLIPPQGGGDTEGNGRGVPNLMGTVAISPDGGRAFFAAKKDNIARGMTRDGLKLTFENTVRTTVIPLNLADLTSRIEDRFDIDNSNLPSALIFSPRGDQLFVALEGNRQVRVLDPYNGGSELARIVGTGSAPGGLLVDADRDRLYVHCILERQIEVYDIKGVLNNSDYAIRKLAAIRTILRETLSPEILLGKRLFHSADSALSRDGYVSCAVCHPDGKSDGMVWDFTDRGEGLRKTIPLLGRAGLAHGPLHWSANFDEVQDFEHDIRGPFAGTGLMEDPHFTSGTRDSTWGDAKAGLSPSLDALAAYVASLASVNPSPFRDPTGRMTAAALRGQAHFRDPGTACSACHAGPHFTDSKISLPGDSIRPDARGVYPKAKSVRTREGFLLHDVGTVRPASGHRLNDVLPGLDTPTLKGIWQFPPYLHDGSAATLREVLVDRNPEDRHGRTSHLRSDQIDDLIAYLMQLDEDPESGPSAPILRARHSSKSGKATLSFKGDVAGRQSIRALVYLGNGSAFDFSGRKVAHEAKPDPMIPTAMPPASLHP